jgi:hypothetical protein
MSNSLIISGLPYAGPTTSASSTNPLLNGYRCPGEVLPPDPIVPSSAGIFVGTLSAHGNLIAMATNEGIYNYINNNGFLAIAPYLSGYLREYWRNPASMSLGRDSAIPAITAVIPASFTDISGNLLYYIDLQLTRLTGSNYFDNFSFINVFNQVLNWVTTSNGYIVGLKNSENTNVQYYGSNNYQEFLTQGYSRYKSSIALKRSLSNLGRIITEINIGYFGTPNSIASIMIKSGLSSVGNLVEKLNAANVNINNIYNSVYSQQISQVLLTINSPSDLIIIQDVLKTTVSNLKSPLDYISIEKTSGVQNDSFFRTLVEFGIDIRQRTPLLIVETGAELVEIIDSVLDEITPNIENLASEGTLLPQTIIDELRNYLPISSDNGPVSMLDVIGMASGYLTEDFKIVNDGLLTIENSAYGIQIHNALEDIGFSWKAYSASVRSVQDGDVATTFFTKIQYDAKITEYNNLLATIASDPIFSATVESINAAYNRICQATYYEVTNFNRANFSTEIYRDNSQIYNFVNNMPAYAADNQNIGTDTMLYNMCQPNESGDIAKSILNQYKNTQALGEIGVKITGTV